MFTNYPAYNKVNYFGNSSIEDVVETVFNSIPEVEEELDMDETPDYKVLARQIESFIRANPPRGWDVDGPLNLLMPKEMMQQVLTDMIVHMKETGQCVTRSQYDKMQKEGKKFYQTNGDLTRIWGSNHINEMVSGSSEFKGVKHYLVIPDDQQTVDVQVRMTYDINRGCPQVFYINANGAMVVSEFIEGKGIAPSCFMSEIVKTGYSDFSGIANIIEEDRTGIKYVVDTESKSFGYRVIQYFPNLSQLKTEMKAKRNEHIAQLYSYLVDRWEVLSKTSLSNKPIQCFTINTIYKK